MLVSPYFLPKVGGLENYVYNLAREFRDMGHTVLIVTSDHETKTRVEDMYEGFRVVRLPILVNLSNTPINPAWYFNLRKIIKQEKPDIINTHSPVPFMADMAILAAGRIPIIVTYHAGSMKKSSGLINVILGLYENILLPKLLKRAAAIASVYPDFITKRIPTKDRGKVFYAPPCIDPLLFNPGKTKKRGDGMLLLFVGRIETTSAWKGLDVLLVAMKELADMPKLTLRIVGSGDADEIYKQQAIDLGITDRVEFVGALRDEALAEAYREASILVLPSKTDAEAFGTVTIEAMACGTPVVASRIGGVPDVIKATGGGVLVTPGNAHKLARTIRELTANPTRLSALARIGTDAVHRQFVWNSTAEAYAAKVQQLVREKQPTVIHITPYFPPHLGGMENVAQELAAQLANSKRSVEVITSDISYRNSNFKDNSALAGKVDRLSSTEIAHLPILWGLPWRLLKTPRKSIFHVHIAQAFIPEIALVIARLKRSKFIAHFHLDVDGSGGLISYVFLAYKRALFPFMLRHADKVIVFSAAQQELVNQKYGVALPRIVIIPNGVALPTDATARTYTTRGRRLLYVGRLSSQKRVSLLLETMALLPEKITLSVVGSGELEAALKAQSRKLKLHNVTFHGALFGEKLTTMYDQADVFILVSEREGMPLAILEAMAHGLPVIASDVVGTHELVYKTGVLIDDPTAKKLATAIERWVNPQELTKLSARSMARARTFSWRKIVKQFETIYDEVSKS